MNLIEAWRSAKEGQGIKRKGSSVVTAKKEYSLLTKFGHLHECAFIANDWEVVKERRDEIISGMDVINVYKNGILIREFYHKDMKAKITWLE